MPPPNFTPIRDATVDGAVANFIGVVISYKQARRSLRQDWVLELTIQDDFSTEQIGGNSTMACRLFRARVDDFPKISGPGDIAILRNVKLNRWNGRMDCVNQKVPNSGAVIFPAKTIPVPELSHAYQAGTQRLPFSDSPGLKLATIDEQMAVMHMKKTASAVAGQVKQHAAVVSSRAPPPDKLSLIKDLDFNRFYDVRAQVVNIYYTRRDTVELKISDYTTNTNLFYYADPDEEDAYLVSDKNWKGPYGQMTLNVILYESNASWARNNVSVGDLVFLRNMRTKISPANKLEGALHQDRDRPTQVDIGQITTQSDIDEINQRKDAYEKQRPNKSVPQVLQTEPEKPTADAAAEPSVEPPANAALSKNTARNKKNRQKQKEKREAERKMKEAEQQELEEKATELEAAQSGINANIRTAYPEMKLSTVSEILNNPARKGTASNGRVFRLPFVNAKYKARVRVVDCFPPMLKLFAHSTNDPYWMGEQLQQEPNKPIEKDHWEWGFFLLVEDATVPPGTIAQKVRIAVNDAAGQRLLDMDAVDLKKDLLARQQLEERLFILWGNILELKTLINMKEFPLPAGDSRIQNKPFDAYIEEYGVKRPISKEFPKGYQQMWRLDHTKISF